MINSGQRNVRHESIKARDTADAEPIKHEANRVQPAECCHILNDQSEGVPGSLAEPVVGEGYLDVCVLRNKLDALLERPEKVARVAEQALDNGAFIRSLDLFPVILE